MTKGTVLFVTFICLFPIPLCKGRYSDKGNDSPGCNDRCTKKGTYNKYNKNRDIAAVYNTDQTPGRRLFSEACRGF